MLTYVTDTLECRLSAKFLKLAVFVGCLFLRGSCLVLVGQESEGDRESFSLIVLPDTQGYADVRHQETQEHWPEIGDQRSCFYTQTEWIKKNREMLNIVMVAHVGDITQTEHEEEWKIADAAFKIIDDEVPYILCSGNHDMGYSPQHRQTSHSRESRFSAYFSPSRFTENSLYDPHFGSDRTLHFREQGKIENYYLFLNAGGLKFLVLALEFKPRDETLAWAKIESTGRCCYNLVHQF